MSLPAAFPPGIPTDLAARIWSRDPALFGAAAVNRLGWLGAPEGTLARVGELEVFARECAAAGLRRAVILGMGGSSLCPLVLSRVFPARPGFLELSVCDTTSPGEVARLLEGLKPESTLFVVSSKSGTTVEPQSLYLVIREALSGKVADPGSRFAAITDPGTPLERQAREEGFRALFSAPPDVGGRYSALTVFGMLPAALMGLDLRGMLEGALSMAGRCRAEDPERNPGLALGAWMARQAAAGRDKLTLAVSPALAPFALWLEQLIAESTGKGGRGIIPVAGEAPGSPAELGRDRAVARIRLAGDAPDGWDAKALRTAGIPVFDLGLDTTLELGAEFFRWEMAVAAAGALLALNPFDEPNVSESKKNTLDLLEERRTAGALPAGEAQRFPPPGSGGGRVPESFRRLLEQARPGGYLAILAYLPYSPATEAALGDLRTRVRALAGLATTFGYGPRYLHSTGQVHKGGPASGIFLILTEPERLPVSIPGAFYTLGELHLAQALGDERALRGRGLPVLRIHLEGGAGDLQELVRVLGS